MSRELTILCSITLLVCGCSRSAVPVGLITRFGEYRSPDGRATLTISRREKALVHFSIRPDGGVAPSIADVIGSDAMRWCLYWGASGDLWAYSSDTGYFSRIEAASSSNPTAHEVTQGSEVPQVIYHFLPSSIRGRWKAVSAEPGGAANRSQPIRTETNRRSSTAGSDR
jgi:hypothetical protein